MSSFGTRQLTRGAWLFLVVLTAFSVIGTALGQQAPTAQPNSDYKLRIGGGDLIEVSVYSLPEMPRVVRVSASGQVGLPMIGAVRVGGLTPEEAQAAIAGKLRSGGFLNEPQVIVTIRQAATQGISVLGEVKKPGIYALRGRRQLLDAIASAGGLTEKAGRELLITRRSAPEQPQRVMLGDNPEETLDANLEIYPGDTIVVTKAGLVYVVGEVMKPGGFIMENNTNLTVLQALAMAQGVGKNPVLDGARVIRKSASGMEEIPIPLKKIMKAQAEDMPLLAEDILFVPTSATKGLAKRTLDSVIQTASSAVIYRR